MPRDTRHLDMTEDKFTKEFEWSVCGDPIDIKGSLIACRFWNDHKPVGVFTTEDGGISCTGEGKFELKIDNTKSLPAGADMIYDISAVPVGGGFTHITKGTARVR